MPNFSSYDPYKVKDNKTLVEAVVEQILTEERYYTRDPEQGLNNMRRQLLRMVTADIVKDRNFSDYLQKHIDIRYVKRVKTDSQNNNNTLIEAVRDLDMLKQKYVVQKKVRDGRVIEIVPEDRLYKFIKDDVKPDLIIARDKLQTIKSFQEVLIEYTKQSMSQTDAIEDVKKFNQNPNKFAKRFATFDDKDKDIDFSLYLEIRGSLRARFEPNFSFEHQNIIDDFFETFFPDDGINDSIAPYISEAIGVTVYEWARLTNPSYNDVVNFALTVLKRYKLEKTEFKYAESLIVPIVAGVLVNKPVKLYDNTLAEVNTDIAFALTDIDRARTALDKFDAFRKHIKKSYTKLELDNKRRYRRR